MRVQLQPAYVLHSQAYANTSLIIDAFTLDYGRIRLIAKGARSSKSNNKRAILQAFTPINISWVGRSNLKTLTDVELDVTAGLHKLLTNALFNGLYLNELLMKLLHANDPNGNIFLLYRKAIADLSISDNQAFSLRCFEYQLLECLGYSLGIESLPASNGIDEWYQYHPESGLILYTGSKSALPLVQKRYLMALLAKQVCNEVGMQQLRNLMRFVLHQHLEGKKIQSRALYQ